MRKVSIVLLALVLITECFGQQSGETTVTVAGCVMNVNGTFRLVTHGQLYVLKGQHNSLFN